ncbi:hypothetical protein Ddye_031716 [Dipteronia dyeriana]|uniref:Uncharacterized protein n=1 Tax=Dipteronia dyeriana TaxID=168575 RepID=A0AAD9TIW1_9ROSI|nr:hypothetical protein Ddye_031716 [Dipteronia dyeriana]
MSLTSYVFRPLVERIESPQISKSILLLKPDRTWLEGFKSILRSFDEIFEDAESKANGNEEVKTWVDELSEFSYDVKDLLDKISEKPGVPLEENPLEAIAKTIERLHEQRDELGLTEGREASGSEEFEDGDEDESQVIGRDDDKEDILKSLLSDDDHRTHVITMVGEGGVGKTTLAQLVYNDKKVEKQFEFKAWIHVSEDFDDLLLTKAIVHAFTDPTDNEDLESLQNSLKDHLKRMKFLLVLDNLTSTRSDWRSLQKVLTAGENGSRVIVTTCHPQLQETMGTLPAFTVRSLTYQESWMLFAQHVFPDKLSSLLPEQEIIKIVEKCRGLPLAVKILASVLRFKPDKEEWKALLNNNSILKWEDPLKSILKMCYNDLPIHLKRCAAYCSIFPTHHEYEEKKLILLWMAQGFLRQEYGGMKKGRAYFRNLTYRSFFQPSGANKSCFIMHDLLKDVIHSESGYICSRMGNDECSEASIRPWHLLISGGKEIAERSEEAKFLRTLILCKSSREKESCQLSGEQLNNLFEPLEWLRVLSLSGYDITKLPDSIGKLKRLRFLDLSHTAITQLSASVRSLSKLENLQTLLLSNCSCLTELSELFYSLRYLRSLRFLDLSHTAITKLPDSVGYLEKLQTLFLSNCSCLTWLPDSLKNLRDLQFLDLSHTAITKLPDSVGHLEKLQTLLLSHCSYLTELFDSLHKLRNLKFLDLSHTAITTLPDSVGHLEKLQTLLLSHCSYLTELFDSLHKLRNLKFLDLSHTAITTLPRSVRYLRNLQKLLLSHCTRLTELPISFYEVSNLQLLDLSHTAITELPAGLPNLKNLQKLLLSNCYRLTKLPESLCSMKNLQIVLPDGSFKLAGVPWKEWQLIVVQRTDDSITSKIPPPESSNRSTEDSIAKHGGASDDYSAATENSSSDTENAIDAEESLGDIETSESQPTEFPTPLTGDSSVKHGGASDNSSASTKISPDTDPINVWYDEESLEEQESLNVSEISQLRRLPPKLYSLKIEGVLESLPEELKLDKLQHLYIIDCRYLKSIPASLLRKGLKSLYIRRCKEIEFPSAEETMGPSVEHLYIESSCDPLKSFPLALFPKLKNLSICDCPNLNSISITEAHMPLNSLEIRDCMNLEALWKSGLHTPNLISILLSNCKKLEHLPGQLHELKYLQSLFITECPALDSIPEGGLPSSLNLLRISSCEKLTPSLRWKLHQLNNFSCVEIEGGCRDLESFPEQNLLPRKLNSLQISRFVNLKVLNYEGLQHLTSLQTLKISRCDKLQSLPEEGLPSSLSYLYISDCPKLKPKLQNRRATEWYKIAHIPHIQIDGKVIS